MNFKKFEINNNSNIGVYAAVGSEYGLFPDTLTKDAEKLAEETLGINVLRVNLGESQINGVLSKVIGNKVIVSKVTELSEIKFLEKEGLEVLKVNSYHAIGNLIVNNKNSLLLSTEFDAKTSKKISEFVGMEAESFDIADVPIVGSCVAINNKSFAINPNASEDEFKQIAEMFKVEGNIATINYGDSFVANGLLVTDKGVLMGSETTGFEIIRLDDIFG